MINKCLNIRKERKWEAGAHNFSLRRVWILARTRQQRKIIFLYSWAKVWWNGGFSDNTALNKCLSWPLIPTPEQQHAGSVGPCCKQAQTGQQVWNKSSAGALGSRWEDGDAISFGTGMGLVTPGCLTCPCMFPGFARRDLQPSLSPSSWPWRQGWWGQHVWGAAQAVIKLLACSSLSSFPPSY